MGDTKQKIINYIYTYAFPEDEQSLCALEMRSMFGVDTSSNLVKSKVEIDPSRSPFIKERIAVLFEETSLQELLEKVATLQLNGATFKVIYVKNASLANADKEGFELRRTIEREIGLQIDGEADFQDPDRLFGVMNVNDKWIFRRLC